MTSPHITIIGLWLGLAGLGCGSAAAAVTPATAPNAGTLALALTPAPAPAPAGASGILTGKLAAGSGYDQLWSVPLLYKNEANPWLQELALQGHLQTQYASGSNAAGSFGTNDLSDACTWDDVEVRRFRLGLRARLWRPWRFHSLFDIYPDLAPRVYKGIAETYISYAPSDACTVSLGKAELKFTREQEISTRDYLPFERSQLVNQFYGGELCGAWISGKGLAGGWLYELGAYSNERQDEWSNCHGGTIVLAKIGYNYTQACGIDFAQAEFHYLHNSAPGYRESAADLASPLFSNCIALANDLTKGRFSLATELFWGDGALGQPDVCGLTLMPSCFLATKLQLVTTFQFAGSRDANGICLPNRYEALAPDIGDKKGDAYFAGYAGLNYYFYGHKLKVMSGAKFSHLAGGPGGGDYNGWTWLAGVRTAF
jgi:phosphate-selective porin OprO/OprP